MKKIISKAISALLAASMIIPIGTAAAFADDSAVILIITRAFFITVPARVKSMICLTA